MFAQMILSATYEIQTQKTYDTPKGSPESSNQWLLPTHPCLCNLPRSVPVFQHSQIESLFSLVTKPDIGYPTLRVRYCYVLCGNPTTDRYVILLLSKCRAVDLMV